MRYYIDTLKQNIPATVEDLAEAGFQFVVDKDEVFFSDDVTPEDLAPFNIICVE